MVCFPQLSHGRKTILVYICGDLNGRTGEANDTPDNHLFNNFFFDDSNTVFDNLQESDTKLPVRHSEDKTCNTQGRSLLSVFKESDLRVVNGRHVHDATGKYTFYRDEPRSVIDYLIVQSGNFNNVLSFSVHTKLPDSDHCPISFSIKCHFPKSAPKKPVYSAKTYTKYKWNIASIEKFHENLWDTQGLKYTDNFFNSMELLEPPEQVAEKFCELIRQAAERCLDKSKPGDAKNKSFPVNKWFDADCKTVKAILHQADTLPSIQLSELERDYKRIIKKKKRRLKLNRTKDILSAKTPTEMCKKLDSLCPKTNSSTSLSLQDFSEFYSKPAVTNANNSLKFDLSVQKEVTEFIEN